MKQANILFPCYSIFVQTRLKNYTLLKILATCILVLVYTCYTYLLYIYIYMYIYINLKKKKCCDYAVTFL